MIYKRVYFWAVCSVPLVYMSVFMPVPWCFDDCNFLISFEIKKCESSKIVHLFQYCFGYSGSLEIPMNFRMGFSIFANNVFRIFDRECIDSVDHFVYVVLTTEIIMWVFFPFILLLWCVTLISFHMLNHSCIPGTNPTWSWCIINAFNVMQNSVSILLRIFASMFIRGIRL